MGSPIIWFGNATKLLKSKLDFFGQSSIESGTTDPSSVATAGNKGSLYLNTSNANVYIKGDNGTTTNWTAITGGAGYTQSFVYVTQGLGHGSTNTKVRTFQNLTDILGTDITYTADTVNGDYFTINTTGVYSISYQDAYTGGANVTAIIQNPTVGTGTTDGNLVSYTDGNRGFSAGGGGVGAGGFPSSIYVTLYCNAGDTIRFQDQGLNDVTSALTFIRAIRIG